MSGLGDKNCIVITCRIDGRDSSGIGLYGVLVSVLESTNLLFSGAFFGRDPIDESLSVIEMITLVNSQRHEEHEEELANIETSLDDFIRSSQLFQNEKVLSDPKTLEHKITYFCTTVLSLNAITFISVGEIPNSELSEILPSLKNDGHEETDEDTGEEDLSISDGDEAEDALLSVAVRCDPVLDPASGVPVASLEIGTTIYCKMRENSAYYNLMAKVSPDFDGVVSGDVVAVHENEQGSVTVVVNLSDDVTGAFKALPNIRLKLVEKPVAASAILNRFSTEIIFAVAGVIFFLCLMAVLLHYLT